MSIKLITLCSVLVIFLIHDVHSSKHTTSSQLFVKLNARQTTRCNFINRDFSKLKGDWHFILRTVTSKNVPKLQCGHLVVSQTSENGFNAHLDYIMNNSGLVKVPISALFINNTFVEMPELNKVLIDNPQLDNPYIAQMGTCDNDTIFFFEPVYYYGGIMVFSRNVIDSLTGHQLRFSTYDEQEGKETMVKVPADCNGWK